MLDELQKEHLRTEITKAIQPPKHSDLRSMEVPEITPEMNAVIEEAFSAPMSQKVAEFKSGSLTRKDLETLTGKNWLNDEVINYYMSLIVQRSEKIEDYPKVYAYSTFFYPSLKTRGYASVRRWTRKIDIFSYDMLLMPLHLAVHWSLAVIYPAQKRIECYDSMISNHLLFFSIINEYIIAELKDKKGQVDTSGYHIERMKTPDQMNGSDCGMLTLKYAEYISRNAHINFDQGNMPYFRRRMMYELLTNTLL